MLLRSIKRLEHALSGVYTFSISSGEKFDEDVLLTFNIDPSKVKNWDSLVLGYYDSNNNFKEYNDQFVSINKETGEIVVKVNHFSTYAIIEVEGAKNNLVAAVENEDSTTIPPKNNGEKPGSETDNTTKEPAAGSGERLPDTATNQFNIMMIGSLFLFLGIASVFITKRRKAIH